MFLELDVFAYSEIDIPSVLNNNIKDTYIIDISCFRTIVRIKDIKRVNEMKKIRRTDPTLLEDYDIYEFVEDGINSSRYCFVETAVGRFGAIIPYKELVTIIRNYYETPKEDRLEVILKHSTSAGIESIIISQKVTKPTYQKITF